LSTVVVGVGVVRIVFGGKFGAAIEKQVDSDA
jgi:hypothetical protein